MARTSSRSQPSTFKLSKSRSAKPAGAKAGSSKSPASAQSKRLGSHDQGMKLCHLRPSLATMILADNPGLTADSVIEAAVLARYRMAQIQSVLLTERGELSQLDREVVQSISERATITANTEEEFEGTQSIGDIVADKIAVFGGSWAFILSFLAFIFIWVSLNLFQVFGGPFDPFPFILMNLMLSCIAALQAPIIMMSQNRQESKDRLRGEHDYQINLKAELEIRLLHEKIDHLLTKQWERMSEIQAIQTELLQDLTAKKRRP